MNIFFFYTRRDFGDARDRFFARAPGTYHAKFLY